MGEPSGHDSAWFREGPCRMLQGGQWRRKNGPVACDLCRKRRVRCSCFETGAPCDSCIRRQVPCIIGDDEYAFDAKEPTKLFVPILPPPGVPCPTPVQFDEEVSSLALDLDALCVSLNESAPRPAPLVWKSPNERSTAPSVPGLATSRLRKKRARSTSNSRGRSESRTASLDGRRPRSLRSPSKKTRRETFEEQEAEILPAFLCGVLDRRTNSLVRCAEWLTRTVPVTQGNRVGAAKQDKPNQPQFPVSSVRDDDLDDAIGVAGPSHLDVSRSPEPLHSRRPSLDTVHNPPYPSPVSDTPVSTFAPYPAPYSHSFASSPPSFVPYPYPASVAPSSSMASHRRRSSVESATSTLSSPTTVFSSASGGNSSWTSAGPPDDAGPPGGEVCPPPGGWWDRGFVPAKVQGGDVGAGWKTVSWD
ncbi:hypothetical protein JCM5296_004346 [Sporobolomyces johnsonii]